MPDEALHQPHDKLFRATFSNPENAAGFLRHHLDATLTPLVDWNSLALLPGQSNVRTPFSEKLGLPTGPCGPAES